MRGLRKKLLINYGLFIIFTIILAEMALMASVKPYYNGQVARTLLDRATVAADFYNKFLPDYDINYKSQYIMEDANRQQSINVQVLDKEGHLLRDSEGFYQEDLMLSPDVKKAIQGQSQVCQFQSKSGEPLMAISVPLTHDNKQVGFLRYITSTEQLRTESNQMILLGLGAGILVLLFSGVFILLLARSIINPVEELTTAAKHIAAGDYSIRAVRHTNDEIGDLADTFNYMVEQIAHTEQLKNEFISSVSHELRTPLTSIKGWSETLLSGNPDNHEETMLGLTYISEETDRLSGLVEDLLDFSRYQAGGITLSLDMVNINTLVMEVAGQFGPRTDEKGINLELNINPLSTNLQCDRNRIKQVLINLLDNAVKFTPKGGNILISTEIRNNSVIITVADNGWGIAPEDLPRASEKFFKAKSQQSGSGLGLSICKEIIALHQGDMKIISELQQGTMVTISLPQSQHFN